jgi:predicted metal-dependent hydrolase
LFWEYKKILFNRVKIKNKNIKLKIKRRRGLKTLRLSLDSNGALSVTAPKWYPLFLINNFIQEKSEWIWERLKNIDLALVSERQKEEKYFYQKNKLLAQKIMQEKVELFNRHYGFIYYKISIKNQKTCWGSCSQRKNLNFNVRILKLSADLQNYIIVHELCHLQELNHGQNFWELVAQTIPNFKELRKSLRQLKVI